MPSASLKHQLSSEGGFNVHRGFSSCLRKLRTGQPRVCRARKERKIREGKKAQESLNFENLALKVYFAEALIPPVLAINPPAVPGPLLAASFSDPCQDTLCQRSVN